MQESRSTSVGSRNLYRRCWSLPTGSSRELAGLCEITGRDISVKEASFSPQRLMLFDAVGQGDLDVLLQTAQLALENTGHLLPEHFDLGSGSSTRADAHASTAQPATAPASYGNGPASRPSTARASNSTCTTSSTP